MEAYLTEEGLSDLSIAIPIILVAITKKE